MINFITTFEKLYSIYFHDWIPQRLENGSPQNFEKNLSFKIWCYAKLYWLVFNNSQRNIHKRYGYIA